MQPYPLHVVVCRLRAAHESSWNTVRRRAHIAAVHTQARALVQREKARHQGT